MKRNRYRVLNRLNQNNMKYKFRQGYSWFNTHRYNLTDLSPATMSILYYTSGFRIIKMN